MQEKSSIGCPVPFYVYEPFLSCSQPRSTKNFYDSVYGKEQGIFFSSCVFGLREAGQKGKGYL
ncbi:hypothetical protein OUZ56_021767 [Daphnia magna]|uniref:Uncharacterized protein n=1 Tax=Daphnia magna TaxID=35525 RepID=A0ABR0AUF8_9CRUS|nr:hypothetical protein OUZ56_021767 [Daphnia magna]